MTLQELLNSDVQVIGGQLLRAWRWWISELAELVPGRSRANDSRSRPVVQLGPDASVAAIWRHGRQLSRGAGALAADVAVPEGLVLTREVALPILRLAETRRLVLDEIDRLTPSRGDAVYGDVAVLARDEARRRQTVRVAVIRRSEAEAALQGALRSGVVPLRLGLMDDDLRLVFDFMASMRSAGRGGRQDRRAAWLWVGVGVLVAANLGLLIWRDSADVASLSTAVDEQRPLASLAVSVRRRVETDDATRRLLLARRSGNEPLRFLDAVGRVFPSPQWIERFEWNGRSLRLVGWSAPAFDVLAAIARSPVISQPRALATTASTPSGDSRPFDLVAEPRSQRP